MKDQRAPQSAYRRLRRLAQSEVSPFRPRASLMQGVANLLPQFCFNQLRTALWRAAQIPVGKGSLVMGEMIVSGAGDWSAMISVGDLTYINGPLRIEVGGSVRIGNGVNIGHDCLFVTVVQEDGPHSSCVDHPAALPIVIEDGVWIASRVTLLPGVTVGTGSVVAAGAVVASNVAPHTLVGGVPARVLRKLDAPPFER